MPPSSVARFRLWTTGSVGLLALALTAAGCAAPATTSTRATGVVDTPSSSSAVAAPVAGSAGIGDPYWPLDGNGGIDVKHYDIRDRYEFAGGRLSGTTTLTIRATRTLSRFNLDLLLPVEEVFVDGAPAAHSRPHKHELQITPAAPIVAGAVVEVTVSYAGKPGQIEYAGEGNWLADDREVVTMNEPHMAPWWFPANDHPRDKARFDIAIKAPASHQVVANGLFVDRTVSGDLATTHWRSNDPMVPYLAFFAAGRYDVQKGTFRGLPWYAAVSRTLSSGQREASMRLMKRSRGVTAWLENHLGEYPFESTGGLTTGLQPGFALENQTRPTYPALSGGGLSLVVHELAHQWFGNSVAVESWSDIWLNEGLATFMEVYYTEKHGGRTGTKWLRDSYLQQRSAAGFWRLRLDDPGRNNIFDNAVYVRGAMTAQALRDRVGERDYWRILRTWVRTHRDGNGSSTQFEKRAGQISGERLGSFFDAWLRGAKPPKRTAANGL